ncbi:MAG TPA: cation diffusion facilitator family transporter [Candidatus Limnocylindria bacterium]|nr:cation diffusion facilitator family transporter [Candidatus Limnocylindria bacterium]
MTHQTSAAGRYRSRLMLVLGISATIFVVELVAGLATNSLALLADAGHVFADVAGTGVSLLAIWLAARPPTSTRSFGLYRLEIVAATANALLLFAVSGLVLWEGIRRLNQPPDLAAGPVVAVAAFALLANTGAALLLARGRRESLTVRAAYLEILGDLLGSAAVLAAGAVILLTRLHRADAVASIFIALLILPRAWGLMRDSVDVLLEATPRDVNLDEVRRHILDTPGVEAVHDLHAWTITSGMKVVSAHVVLGVDGDPGALLDHLSDCLSADFDVDHSTFQLETPEHVLWEGAASRTQH